LKKCIALFFILFILLPFIINTEAKSKLSDEPVARLDGKAITKIDLVGYIKKTENKQYNDLLSSSETGWILYPETPVINLR
jgi:hypothetical protein